MRIFILIALVVFFGSFKSDAPNTIEEGKPVKKIILSNKLEFLFEPTQTNNLSSGQGIHCTMQIKDY